MVADAEQALILGNGYSARFLRSYAEERSLNVAVRTTSRSGAPHVLFDLLAPETWENIPAVEYTFWTFSPEPPHLVKNFLDRCGSRLGKIVVIGTTSSFQTHVEHEVVNETSTLDLESPRVQAELEIQRRGGVIVHSAGIYGPDRNPLHWMSQGRVRLTSKKVNLIHAEDLAQIVWKAMLHGVGGASYIASDNRPYTWAELFEAWKGLYQIQETPSNAWKPANRISKIIDSRETHRELGVALKYRDVLEGVASLSNSPR